MNQPFDFYFILILLGVNFEIRFLFNWQYILYIKKKQEKTLIKFLKFIESFIVHKKVLDIYIYL